MNKLLMKLKEIQDWYLLKVELIREIKCIIKTSIKFTLGLPEVIVLMDSIYFVNYF